MPPMPPAPLDLVSKLNGRFNQPPWEAAWVQDILAPAGILIHVVDGWEDGAAPWAPATKGPGARDMSASLVFAANRVPGKPIPLFGSGQVKGLIFKPGATKLRCGKSTDSSGKCTHQCGTPDLNRPWNEATEKLCSWQPRNFGTELHRLSDYQRRTRHLFYNEVIIDAAWWRDHLPDAIDAIVGDRELHRNFVAHFGLHPNKFPLLDFNRNDWGEPFGFAY
tara:strand:- start:1672 stop:2334 length:663 start_codon:yes stop_codon:yes gene_type:complete